MDQTVQVGRLRDSDKTHVALLGKRPSFGGALARLVHHPAIATSPDYCVNEKALPSLF